MATRTPQNKSGIEAPSPKKKIEDKNPAPTTTRGVEPYQPSQDEPYMGDAQRKHFRNLLQIWKAALLKSGDKTLSGLRQLGELGEVPADPIDVATNEGAIALDLRARDRERKLINKIDEAIQRIDNKDYGYCDECGVDIGIRRLEARPTATLCIDCKMLDEVREKQRRS
ncbi:MAG TPA: RNA polymerase-binding protein DksA [Gammaproteobacteria bacterium]|nr:RNA polymerase-binding protein DksA [Gammaproteobacteria bacterium]